MTDQVIGNRIETLSGPSALGICLALLIWVLAPELVEACGRRLHTLLLLLYCFYIFFCFCLCDFRDTLRHPATVGYTFRRIPSLGSLFSDPEPVGFSFFLFTYALSVLRVIDDLPAALELLDAPSFFRFGS